MQTTEALTLLEDHLAEGLEFDVTRNQALEHVTVPLYARRKKGSQEFLFIYDADALPSNVEALKSIHEQGRKYANSFFKLPKAFRLKIPNILSIFVKTRSRIQRNRPAEPQPLPGRHALQGAVCRAGAIVTWRTPSH